MASLTRAASVPSTWSSRPAAISIGGGVPRTIWSASSTADSAKRRLCETTTMPTTAHPYDGRANTVAAASKSNAEDVAPGSWWPALRSPR